MKKLLLFGAFLLGISQVKAQKTFPKNGVYDTRPQQFVFKNATIHVDANTVITDGMLYIKNGVIEAIGKDFSIPEGSVVYDLQKKHIYPAFVESYADYGMPEIQKDGMQRGFFSAQLDSKKTGAYAWNQAIKSENDAANEFKTNAKAAETLRKLGFGAAVVHVNDGIARGTSALVALGDGKENDLLLKTKVSAHYSLNKGTSTQTYPVSVMGAVALLRQTLYDADWYKKGGNALEKNISLEAINNQTSLPQVFEASDKLGILRGDKIGDEFGFQYIIKTNGDEYQNIDEIKATNASLIIPIEFPNTFDVEDPFDARNVSLKEMKHWELAPANASFLANAGINFAITSSNLKKKEDFWANIRKAIEMGLPESKALEALTTTPAKLLQIDNQVGSLKKGLLANFLITSSQIFEKENILYENWIQGKQYVINESSLTDIRGNYKVTIGENSNLKLAITGTYDKPEYEIFENDTLKLSPKFSRTNNLFTIQSKTTNKDTKNASFSAYLDGKNIKGTGLSVDGKPLNFVAEYVSDFTPKVKKDTNAVKKPELGKIIYPFTAFGTSEKPKQETILVKNTTVWTNEKEGILKETDVLLQNGKIASIGKSLPTPSGGKVIDGTGKVLTNGILDEHSHIALVSINEVQTVSAEVRQEDALNPEDVNIYRQLAGGVTTSQLLHGSADCIGGQSAIIKLKWGEFVDGIKFKNADSFIKFALGENVKQSGAPQRSERFPVTRMGVEQVYFDAFTRAKEYEKANKEYAALRSKMGVIPPRKDLELDALVEILNDKRFITCHSYVQSEINMLMHVADSLKFKINTFTHILEGYKVADKMKARGINASTFSDWWAYKMEVREAIPYNAAIMHRLGINTAINSDDAEMARRLNQEAAKIVLYGGVSEEDAWKMVTLNPAKMMHLDNRIGSIKVGKDADVVLWNDNPLSIYARPLYTIVDGTIYFSEERDTQLKAEAEKERNRLIQKMLQEKNKGGATQKPQAKKPQQHIECDTIIEWE